MMGLVIRHKLFNLEDLHLRCRKFIHVFYKDMCVFHFLFILYYIFIHLSFNNRAQIAIDSAIFPEGTSGKQLDVLARKALWKDGMNYMVRVCLFSIQTHKNKTDLDLDVGQHGTGHGFGAFLSVHEGPHSFSSNIPLVPGHVITNEPGFCKFLYLFSPDKI